MTIMTSAAKNSMAQTGEKYTEALRGVEFELLLGSDEAYRPGGVNGAKIEDMLPLLRKIKPIKIKSAADGEVVLFVQPKATRSFNSTNEIVLEATSLLPTLGQDLEIAGSLTISFAVIFEEFTYEEDRKSRLVDSDTYPRYDVGGTGAAPMNIFFIEVNDRVIKGNLPYHGDPEQGIVGSEFALVGTTISSEYVGENMSYHIDLRGLSHADRVDLIANTVNNLHDSVVKVDEVKTITKSSADTKEYKRRMAAKDHKRRLARH